MIIQKKKKKRVSVCGLENENSNLSSILLGRSPSFKCFTLCFKLLKWKGHFQTWQEPKAAYLFVFFLFFS